MRNRFQWLSFVLFFTLTNPPKSFHCQDPKMYFISYQVFIFTFLSLLNWPSWVSFVPFNPGSSFWLRDKNEFKINRTATDKIISAYIVIILIDFISIVFDYRRLGLPEANFKCKINNLPMNLFSVCAAFHMTCSLYTLMWWYNDIS